MISAVTRTGICERGIRAHLGSLSLRQGKERLLRQLQRLEDTVGEVVLLGQDLLSLLLVVLALLRLAR